MKKEYLALLIIIVLAAFLRFWQLGINPPSLTWDEVAWGYNAYSLGIDGRDEFGRFLPHDYLESFGDFKPPVYAYLTILPVKLFGLNEFAVRFPSALFATLTVLITYFLVKRIFDDKFKIQNAKIKSTIQNSKVKVIALLSSLFLAISPWHINLSRAAFEANVATFFLVTGVWLFLGGIAEKRWYLIFSIISFILSLYTFNTARVIAPLLIVMLTVGFRKELLQRKMKVFIAVLVGIVFVAPLIQFLLSPQAQLRYKEVNIFSDLSLIERANQEVTNDNSVWWSKIIHNRRAVFAVEFIRHYFDNLSPDFLFIKGDGNPKFSTQDVGQLFLWDLPFLLIGVFFLFKKREGAWWIIPSWLLLGIIPAATARETPHALRIEATLPTFQIIVAYGVINIISNIKYQISNMQIKYLIFSLCVLFLLFNFLYYFHGYYAHYPREYSGEWQYGYKESIEFAESVKDNYDQINVTNLLGRPYIYYLFYTKTPPSDFRKTAIVKRDAFGFVNVEGFGKYRFGDDLGKLDNYNKRILYINAPGRVSGKVNVLKDIRLLNGASILIAYEIVYVH